MNNTLAPALHNEWRATKFDRLLVVVTKIMGYGSLSLILFLFFNGALNLFRLDLGDTAALAFNTALSLVFFVQHSGMIRRSFRNRLPESFAEKYHGVLYTISTSILLIMIALLWQKSDYLLWSAPDALRWILRGMFVACLVGFYLSIRALGRFDAFGVLPLLKGVESVRTRPVKLRVRGPYRWVRHPLYFLLLLMIWSSPVITSDRLLLNLLWTAWVVIGTYLEEQDLVAFFGDDYRDYQRRTPMLIPTSLRPSS